MFYTFTHSFTHPVEKNIPNNRYKMEYSCYNNYIKGGHKCNKEFILNQFIKAI